MISLRDLRATTGRLSWLAGILPRCRWAVSILYAVVAAAEKDARDGTEEARAANRPSDQRPKPFLVPAARVKLPRQWLVTFLERAEQFMLRTEAFYPMHPDLAIITDASPQGVGAILCYVNLGRGELIPWAAMEAPVRKEDTDWLGLEFGEASSQGALEAWAVLLAVRMWKTRLRQVPLLIKSDSTVALAIAQKLSSPSPTVNWVGAELALRLEWLDVPKLIVAPPAGALQCRGGLALATPRAPSRSAVGVAGSQDSEIRRGGQATFSSAAPRCCPPDVGCQI